MKNFIFILVAAFLLLSCTDSKRKAEKQRLQELEEAYTALSKAENSEEVFKTVILGLKFGWKQKDLDKYEEELYKNQPKDSITITKEKNKYQDSYTYYHKIKIGKKEYQVYAMVALESSESNITSYNLVFDKESSELLINLKEEYKDFTAIHCRTSDMEGDEHYYWIQDNLVIDYTKYATHSIVTFINAPKDKPTSTLDFEQKIAKEVKEDVKKAEVMNSPWDGSVYQVKKYLKQSLKDPNSYESIDWSEVQKNGDCYIVRHKYRAKNSFGGYVIENTIFTLDSQGNVISTANY